MSRNKEYAAEMATATKFLEEHPDPELKGLLGFLEKQEGLLHSDRWSIIYDYVYKYYNKEEIPSCLVTGLSYLVEK